MVIMDYKEQLIAEARKASPGDDPTDLAVMVHHLANALEDSELRLAKARESVLKHVEARLGIDDGK